MSHPALSSVASCSLAAGLKPASAALMAFFKNRNFNLIYVHGALQAIVMYGGEAFEFVYLLKAGIAPWIVLLVIGLMFGSRVVFRGGVLPLAKRYGLRNALVFGILLEAITYPILSQVTGVGPLLFIHITTVAISSSFYWTSFHAYVSLIGDAEHRGKQSSAMEFIGMIMGVVAPIMTGTLLTYFNPLVAFGIVGLIMAASAIPLLYTPNIAISPDAIVPQETRRMARRIMFADGLRAGSFHFTWLIALFITLGSSFAVFGGAMSLAGLAGAMMGLMTGKLVDLGKGRRALQIGFMVLGVAILARAFGYAAVWSAVAANVIAVIVWPIYATATNSRIYDLAKQSPCPLRYHIVAEGGWDIGTAIGCLVSAILIYLGFSYFVPLLVALLGCGLGYWVLTKSFVTAQPAKNV
jgi:MFS transporter, DHA1 family, inner membrane transport protein